MGACVMISLWRREPLQFNLKGRPKVDMINRPIPLNDHRSPG